MISAAVETVVVSGAGSAEFNGVYAKDPAKGAADGVATWRKVDGDTKCTMNRNSDGSWYMCRDHSGSWYSVVSKDPFPPMSGWGVGSNGSGPVPTIEHRQEAPPPPPAAPLASLAAGTRVRRGPDWKWEEQDGGDGKLGKVQGDTPWGEYVMPPRAEGPGQVGVCVCVSLWVGALGWGPGRVGRGCSLCRRARDAPLTARDGAPCPGTRPWSGTLAAATGVAMAPTAARWTWCPWRRA